MKNSIKSKYTQLSQRIADAAQRSQRDISTITLLAVSKTHSAARIEQAYALGLRDFGENYLQEALEKIKTLSELSICWHFIGSIQSNKTADISAHFAWVHSIERRKIARRLNAQRPDDMPPLNCCIQYNINQDDNKSGVASDQQLLELAQFIQEQPNLRLRGLMTLPAPSSEQTTHAFSQLHTKLELLRTELGASHLDTLSMGMSADLERAIEHGSTLIRIGSALFGARDYSSE